MKQWSVMILFEDEIARDNAARFFDSFVAQRWADSTVDLSWHPTGDLCFAAQAQAAADRACLADLIIFSCTQPGQLPVPVIQWLGESLAQRGEREGAFVGLVHPTDNTCALEKQAYFRRLAHDAGMDYWTGVPEESFVGMPDAMEWYADRAGHVTRVLDNILHQPQPPSGAW